MLMNIPYLRKTNAAFVDWILSQQNGLYFEGERVITMHVIAYWLRHRRTLGTLSSCKPGICCLQGMVHWIKVPTISFTRRKSGDTQFRRTSTPNLTKNIGPMHALFTFMGEAYKGHTQVLCNNL